jgi:PAS domain S-box-containing protein
MPNPASSGLSRRHPLLPATIVLAVCLVLTAGLSWLVHRTTQAWEVERFEALSASAYRNLANSVEYELNAIRAVQGLLHTTGGLTEEQWKRFLPSLNWRRNYPNLLSMGYADWSTDSGLATPQCRVKVIDSKIAKAGFEPGTDLANDPDLLTAMFKAADSTSPASSTVRALSLGNTNGTVQGSLLFLPVYASGTIPRPGPERRAGLKGFAFTALIAVNEYRTLLSSQSNQVVHIEIEDLPAGHPGVKPGGNRPTPVVRLPDGRLEQALVTPGIGRVWKLRFTTDSNFPRDSSRHFPWVVAIVGSLTTLMLFGWLRNQAREKAKSDEWNQRIRHINEALEQRIDERTRELTQANQQLQSEVAIRTESQEMLSQMEELYRRCIGVANAVPYSRDYRTESFTFVGEGIFQITGYSPHELTPQVWETLVEDSQLQGELAGLSVEEGIRRARAGEFKYWRDDCRIRTRDGDTRWVSDASVEVLGPDGKPIGSVGILQDITERKRAEVELTKSLQLERELGQLKTNFVATVSHEFRTPLGIIISSAQILERYQERLSPEARTEHLHSIRDAVMTMARMMEDVLVLSRADAGKLEYHTRELDLIELCRTIIDETLVSTGRRCPITFLPEGDDLRQAQGDETLLRHILNNLVSNAVKYSAAGSAVTVHLRKQGSDGIIEVRDQGRGIPPHEKDRIFEAFHRASNTEGVPGTGLGLVIVKRCVDLHGGQIRYQSQENVGTEFVVQLPLFAQQS